ncbi:hypothetical protein PIB30_051136 [Stylosanthes scabra]|uniref:Uncharacterized protein n=1 Tax=Stylosanthes scabra TaxID=79078 RepID=A0ABU6ZGK4_9FABA|nr:hypothetical protein [Stylosanthes scabra]
MLTRRRGWGRRIQRGGGNKAGAFNVAGVDGDGASNVAGAGRKGASCTRGAGRIGAPTCGSLNQQQPPFSLSFHNFTFLSKPSLLLSNPKFSQLIHWCHTKCPVMAAEPRLLELQEYHVSQHV